MAAEALIFDVIGKILLKEAIKTTFNSAKNSLLKYDSSLEFDEKHFTSALGLTIKKSLNWSKESSFQGLITEKFTENIFIDLDFYLAPIRQANEKEPKQSNEVIHNIFDKTNKHVILLGEPGSGKTTCSKMITKKIIFEENYLPEYSFPLVLNLRDLNSTLKEYANEKVKLEENQIFNLYNNNLLVWYLYNELGLAYVRKNKKEQYFDIKGGFVKRYIIDALENLKPLIILEGFDELDSTLITPILSEIKELCLSLSNARILITSRTGEFNFSINNTRQFQLCPFNDDQIKLFCNKWLGNKESGSIFFNLIKETPFHDTSIRPLNLSFLLMIYESDGILPPRPKSIYEQIVDLQVSRWDKQRNIIRKSKFSEFYSSSKKEFLNHLSFELSKIESTSFSSATLKIIYEKLASKFQLPENESYKVIDELENHSGLFIQSGRDRFQFPHKSIQEYLAAEYIVRYTPLLELGKDLIKMPHELAIATSLSTNSNHIFYETIQIYLKNQKNIPNNLRVYFNRLLVEKVNFDKNIKTAITIISIWNNYQIRKNDYELFDKIYNLNGIRESFLDLKKFYRLENLSPYLYKHAREREITLFLKNEDDTSLPKTIKTPYFFIKDWKYVRGIAE